MADGSTAILVRDRDVDRFAAAVDRLLADRELAGRLGGNGRRLVLAGRTWRTVADSLLDVYAGLLAGSPPATGLDGAIERLGVPTRAE